ncbi:cilia- and flagella-associated protein 251-like [Cyprinus carpio]|uniref:Cilia- and flagella-associated protein 251-like n=1 Tax=Cyprinus carpio TaxID=7962 RepID=A0A9R0AWF6_CYPCA|nr:cilia- and flagella-associated protein 251-like [Cyprinus carpio]
MSVKRQSAAGSSRPHKQILCITYDPQDFVYLFMMVCFGPSYGSPVKKMAILPASKDDDPNSRYMAYITQDKVGIQILPLDGNPHNSFAMICHSTGVSTLACSYDCSRYAFTAGGQDCTVFSWELSLSIVRTPD